MNKGVLGRIREDLRNFRFEGKIFSFKHLSAIIEGFLLDERSD